MNKTVYGPVRSWRFGWSLGVDPIVVNSVCSFNCVYCQLGYIQDIRTKREEFVPTSQLVADFGEVLADDSKEVDVITFSGNGEPTLALNFGEMAQAIRELAPELPLHILTNSTTLSEADVVKDLQIFEEVCCKIDAVTEPTFKAVNRPAPGLTLDSLVNGLVDFRDQYDGELTLQVALLPHKMPDAYGLSSIIKRVNPDKVYLNRPKRPYPESWQVEWRGDHVTSSSRAEHSGRALPMVGGPDLDQWAQSLLASWGERIVLN